MTVRSRSWVLLFAFVFVAVPHKTSAANEAKTNELTISYEPGPILLESTEPSHRFLNRLFQEILSSGDIVFDRFTGPAPVLSWSRYQNNFGYASFERINSRGAGLFATIGLDSLRAAAMAALPVDSWQDYWEARIGHFIADTLGNPEEEHIDLTSISYSAVRSSWEASNEKAGVQFGIRPWSTSPYVYLLAHGGRWLGQSLFTFEGRAGYTLFGSTKIEGRLSVPLPGSCRIAAGASVDPTRIASGDPAASHIAITLERVIRSRGMAPTAVFYLGFRSGVSQAAAEPRHEDMVVAGISSRW
jgi:hypothetical protein